MIFCQTFISYTLPDDVVKDQISAKVEAAAKVIYLASPSSVVTRPYSSVLGWLSLLRPLQSLCLVHVRL